MSERNIYAAARMESGMTQESAASELFIGVSTLRAYETDGRLPQDDVVMRMIDLYDTPWLALAHMRGKCQTLDVIPEVEVQQLPTAVIQLYNRTMAFAAKHRTEQLMQIADDGVIDNTERPEFEQIADELRGIVAAALQVVYVRTKKDPAGCGNIQRGLPYYQDKDLYSSYYSMTQRRVQALKRERKIEV